MGTTTGVRRPSIAAGLATTMALLFAACGSADDQEATGDTITDVSATDPPTTVAAGRGWIDGEPDWEAGGEDAPSRSAMDDAAISATAEAATDESARDPAAPMPVEPDGGIGDGAEPIVPVPDAAPLRAGSVDDNEDYAGFLDYLQRIADLGIALRDLDAGDRSVITVTGADGRPVAGAEVAITGTGGTVVVRTTADGTVRVHPGFYPELADTPAEQQLTAAAGETSVDFARGADAALALGVDGGASAPVPLDIAFLLDATGSMSDEIDRLKETIDSVAERLAALDPAPDVRFAMTLYRDEGDAFVTSTFDFTGDLAEFRGALADVVADGGGDYPEALDEGLAEVLGAPAWRDPADAVQLVFLVADAPPQVGRQVATPYPDSVRAAVARGVKIFPVASSESDDQAEAVFRQIAQATGAPFVFLSYGAGGAATGGSTDIDRTDYEELALDELVVRLVAEELSALSGDGTPVTVPTTTPPPTSNPEGQ